MVAAVRRGAPRRDVARHFRVALSTVQLWVARAGSQRLDRVDWADRPDGPARPANRASQELEDLVLTTRRELKETGEFGGRAIRHALEARGQRPVPAVSTINRILDRRGALDGHRRVRRPAPPPGWYLPDVAAGGAELDSVDIVEGLVIKGGPQVEVL